MGSAPQTSEDVDLGFFRELLNERRSALLGEAERTAQTLGDESARVADPTDRGLLETEASRTLRIRDRERKLLAKIDEALERIDKGSFGVCEECGEAIGFERLKVRPVTTLCIACKAEAEQREPRTWP